MSDQFRQLWSELKTQQYDPTVRRVGKSWVQSYQRKEFDTGNLLELFHENTKLDHKYEVEETGSLATMETPRHKFWQMNAPEYPQAERVELPDAEVIEASLGQVIHDRRTRRQMTADRPTLQELSTLLQHAVGVTGHRERDLSGMECVEDGTVDRSLRAYPSGGGLYPVRPYLLVTGGPDDLDPGLYFYVPEEHCLRVLKRDDDLAERIESEPLFTCPPDGHSPADAGVTLVLTAQFWRSMVKYGPRAYRLILQESGHMVQNWALSAEALGLASVPLGTYLDGPLNEYVGVNGVDEAVLYAASLGGRSEEASL